MPNFNIDLIFLVGGGGSGTLPSFTAPQEGLLHPPSEVKNDFVIVFFFFFFKLLIAVFLGNGQFFNGTEPFFRNHTVLFRNQAIYFRTQTAVFRNRITLFRKQIFFWQNQRRWNKFFFSANDYLKNYLMCTIIYYGILHFEEGRGDIHIIFSHNFIALFLGTGSLILRSGLLFFWTRTFF